MKANIHPQFNDKAQVICVCGNKFTTGSTQDVIHVELCYQCHPFYTGQDRFVDTGSVIQRFEEKRQKAAVHQATIVKKKEEKKKATEGPKSLREMLMGAK